MPGLAPTTRNALSAGLATADLGKLSFEIVRRPMGRGGASLHPGKTGPGVRAGEVQERDQVRRLTNMPGFNQDQAERLLGYRVAVEMAKSGRSQRQINQFLDQLRSEHATQLANGGFIAESRLQALHRLFDFQLNFGAADSAWDEAVYQFALIELA